MKNLTKLCVSLLVLSTVLVACDLAHSPVCTDEMIRNNQHCWRAPN